MHVHAAVNGGDFVNAHKPMFGSVGNRAGLLHVPIPHKVAA
jgi:hypothetical protein